MLKYTFNCLIINKKPLSTFLDTPQISEITKKSPKTPTGYQVVKYIFKRNINRNMWNMTVYV